VGSNPAGPPLKFRLEQGKTEDWRKLAVPLPQPQNSCATQNLQPKTRQRALRINSLHLSASNMFWKKACPSKNGHERA